MAKMAARTRTFATLEDAEKAAERIARLRDVKAVILFGSYARGEQGHLSDIDLCILGDLKRTDKTEALSHSADNLDICFFDELPIHIRFRVLAEGRPLVVKDEEYLDLAKIETIQRYLDFRPLIDRYVREVLRA